MSPIRVLVVEDDPTIVDLIRSNLIVRGYEVDVSADGIGVGEQARRFIPDIVLLDLMMPEVDGFDICLELRQLSAVGIIVVSARGAEHDKVRALNLGADDYLTKPFGIEELLARMTATLRRSRPDRATDDSIVLTFADLRIEVDTRSVYRGEERVQLTATEFTLLKILAINHGQVMPYAALLEEVWGAGYNHSRDYVRVYVGRLRSKLERLGDGVLILNEPRVGYRFIAPRSIAEAPPRE
jgi:two-component system, OmpR family, KDP operon response regulator KdpE